LVLQLLSLLCSTFGRGGDVEDNDSPSAKRVRNEPRMRHPSILQSSLYMNPTPGFGKDKRTCTNVYTSRKCAKARGVRHEEERPPLSDASVSCGEGMLGRIVATDVAEGD